MSVSLNIIGAVDEAVRQLRSAADASKCWGCGCLHHSLDAMEKAIPRSNSQRSCRRFSARSTSGWHP